MEHQTDKIEATQAAPEATQTQSKRVLTEVQRLAFMKGREKRLANIERRKQEKMEEEQQAPKTPEEEIPEHIPDKPLFNEDDFATKIATIVMERIESKIVPPPTPVKPKRKYVKRVESVAPPSPPQVIQPPPPAMKQFSWI